MKRLVSFMLMMVLLLGCAGAQAGQKALKMDEVQNAIDTMSEEELVNWCQEQFSTAVYTDPSEIPYPDNRQEDGFIPEGEFIYEDADKGLWAYLSPTLQVEIVKYEMPEVPHLWYEADVIFNPDEESFTQHTWVNASFKDQQIYPETLAQTSKLVFAVNGDYYLDRAKSNKINAGNIIRRGEIVYTYNAGYRKKFPNLDTLAIRNNGTFDVYAAGEISAEELLAQAEPDDPEFVHDALSFGPYLIRDGAIRLEDGTAAENLDPRCAYGMIEPGHFHFVMVEGKMPANKGNQQGMNLWEVAVLMKARGCTVAMNVDGGSTAVMIFMGTKLNRTGKAKSLGSPRNQHELFGIGESEQVHTDMADGKKK